MSILRHLHQWDFIREHSKYLFKSFEAISQNLINLSWMKLFSKNKTWLLLCQLWETLMICQKAQLYQELSDTEKAWVNDTAFEVNVLQSYLLNSFKILNTASKSNMITESINKSGQESNNSELSNSKLNIKENTSHHALNLVKIIKMICKLKFKCNDHHLMYFLWKWNMHLFSSDASDNACFLYTDVSLIVNLNLNNESIWFLKKQIMLNDYWMKEIICREIQSEKWRSYWLCNFNKKKVIHM